ncbi:MAG TPA: ABC transporter, partial [Tessaracoccus flavescens]|nr:ABC transporter [Tessaracoccus flavescens]
VVSVIVNRCPPGAINDVAGHLAQMLAERGLERARLFAVPERTLPDNGMMPLDDVAGIRQWLAGLASESEARSQVAVQTLAGSVRSLDGQLTELTDGIARQDEALDELRGQAVLAYRQAAADVNEAAGDGTMLRGEILSRWQDLVGTGEFMRSIEERISAVRDRITGWFRGEPKVEAMEVAISDSLATVLQEAGERAAEQTTVSWSRTKWGREIVAAQPDLAKPSPEFYEEAAAAIRAWQSDVLALVEQEGRGKRMKARFLALGTNVLGAALIVFVFSMTAGLTAAEVGIAGGTSLLAQRLLEAVFGEGAVRKLAERAKAELESRVEGVLAAELARFELLLSSLATDPAATERLQGAAESLRGAARAAFDDLTKPIES